jgi:hypothetical protein
MGILTYDKIHRRCQLQNIRLELGIDGMYRTKGSVDNEFVV